MTRSPSRIGLDIKRLQSQHHRAIDSALAPLGISLVQWDALRHLSENPGASLHDLAVLTFQSDQAFGTLARRMIDRGLLERVPGPGRAIRPKITAKGGELRQRAQVVVDEVLADSLGRLSPADLARFDNLLQRLVDDR
ncbi:MarR family transcriptional regulator [Microlunatus endophyticus]|uniref:MarR family transcriptional regulator n=1 Tax=Microlunatus endophyticus TaxID=1716077 RepID=A0A917S4G3_9ACTN|nr:MarR family transcriptional regulator [Microlunatus endophyticus]GGL56320.1 MarR family transcriptional regulator [Microlunatus endophyticus]